MHEIQIYAGIEIFTAGIFRDILLIDRNDLKLIHLLHNYELFLSIKSKPLRIPMNSLLGISPVIHLIVVETIFFLKLFKYFQVTTLLYVFPRVYLLKN